MTKAKGAASPQMSFLDLDQNWFSPPTTKSVLSAVLPSVQQKTGAPDPDQMLRGFTSKLLSGMGVEPGEDLEASAKQAVLRKQLEALGCPKKYTRVAAEEMKDYPNDNISAKDSYLADIDFAPATRRIRVFLLKKEHPDWLSVWTAAEQDIMSGKADLLDFHLRPVNPEAFVKKMQEIRGVNSAPQTILAYTCIDESEYDAVKKEWEKFLSEDSEPDPSGIQMANLLAIYGIYREYGRFQDLPSDLQFYLNCLFNQSRCSYWREIYMILTLNTFPFREMDVFPLGQRENFPGRFTKLREEEASQKAVHGGNHVG